MKRAPVPAVVIILAVVVAVALMGAVLALADGSSSPPECPPDEREHLYSIAADLRAQLRAAAEFTDGEPQ